MKITAMDKIKFSTRGMKILKDLKENPKKQQKLLAALRANGFEEIAELAEDAQKYLVEV